MELLDNKLRARLPRLYTQIVEANPTVYAKFFLTCSRWTWYVLEGEAQGEDFLFFGYVVGLESEFGYFLLSELQGVRNALGLSVERDLEFQEGNFKDVVPAQHR